MLYNTLKKTDIKITRVGYGTNSVGGHNLFSQVDEEQGKKTVLEALHSGINFFDTADAYGFGRSEEILGEVLAEHRQQVVIATKGGIERLENGTTRMNNHPTYLKSALEKSLKRLKTDYVDLYYIHFLDERTPLEESIAELEKLKNEGKIRAIGISNVNIDQLKDANKTNLISAVQLPYNMLERDAEAEILPYCIENDISFIPYGPLAFGILGGKYDQNFQLEQGDWRNSLSLFSKETFKHNLGKIERLKKIADKLEVSLPNLALAWLLQQPGVEAIIPGGKNPKQIHENAKASSVTLTQDDIRVLEEILNS